MEISLLRLVLSLIAGIVAIIVLTVRVRLHPFFALLIACFVTGLLADMPVMEVLGHVKEGFGDILSKLTLIIVLGTCIGVLLEKNGATQVMANAILRWVGVKRSALALSITGFIVGLPIFCDSGYIVLNGINQSLTRKTRFTVAQMSVSLAAGLYSVHCLIPPHPGASAAAGTMGVDFGKLILWGIGVAIPATLIGHWWALYAGKEKKSTEDNLAANEAPQAKLPATGLAFLPVVVPILLMTFKSLTLPTTSATTLPEQVAQILGDPAVALGVGVLLAIMITRNGKKEISHHLGSAVEKAASILIIIAGGAAFGMILAATNIGQRFSAVLDLKTLGIWFPFLLAALIKTAQGSSTVAIVTASSIVLPLLGPLGLESENAKLLTVLALGAGSMMISHSNDAYFWVISKFSGIDIRTMLRVHSLASLWMGLTAMLVIYLLSFIVL